MADKKALEMQHIFKSFCGVHALRDVSFTAYEGKINVLMGENGAGKSTLMRILAGAIQGDSGEIFIDGQKVNIYDPSSSRTAGICRRVGKGCRQYHCLVFCGSGLLCHR